MHQVINKFQLVVSQIKGNAQANDLLLQKYLKLVVGKLAEFNEFEIDHVPREEKTRADVLSQLASARNPKINHSFVPKFKTDPTMEVEGKL